MADPIRYQLPPPISLNNAYANVPGRGRVPTVKYKHWCETAAHYLKDAHKSKISGSIRITLFVPLSRRGDLDNTIKPYLDALAKAGAIDDDRWVDGLHAERLKPKEEAYCLIEPNQEISGEARR